MMILVILTALAAVCGAAKLDKSYLPPISAKTAGGSPGALLAPLDGSNQGLGGLPAGSYTNEVQGVVVDAVNPGTRTSGLEPTGLGGPRTSYGSTDSKVGEAAFKGSVTGLGNSGPNTRIAPGFGSFVESDKSQTDKTSGSTLKFTSDVGLENYSYEFETDNGISVGENGIATNGVQAQGGYSYKGDDGKTYSVTYTADEGGYKPQGQHLPTPPPIPEEILIALEKNAKEEAAGHVDDGSYDAQKYNDEGDYSRNDAGNNNVRPIIGGGDASSGSYVSQGSQAYRPTSGVLVGSYNEGSDASHSSKGNKQSGFGLNKDQSGYQGLGVSGSSSSIGGQFGQAGSSSPQDSNTLGSHGQDIQTAFSSQSTENRFGIQVTRPEGTQAHSHGSVDSSPVRTPSFHNLPDPSAYSSAVTTGSGSASAFASTFPLSGGFKNEDILPSNSFGLLSQNKYNSKVGSDSSAGASFPTPSSTASASISGSQTQQYSGYHQFQGFNTQSNSNAFPSRFGQQVGNSATNSEYHSPSSSQIPSSTSNFGASSQQPGFQSFNSKPGTDINNNNPLPSGHTQFGSNQAQFSAVQPTQPTLGFGSSQGPTKVPDTDLTTPFESNGLAQPASVFNYHSSNQASHSFGSNNIPVSSPNPVASISSTYTEPINANFASNTQQPSISQQQGSDDSYYYKHPSKPFVTPSVISSSQYSNNRQPNFPVNTLSQQGSKYPNTPNTSTTGQYQGTSSSSYNGITQAAISPFTSGFSSSSKPFASQSSQFGSKPTPSSQLGQSLFSQQTSTQFGPTGNQFGQKPIVESQTQIEQSSTSEISDSSSPNQQYQGTIYQYNKPAETLPAQEHKDTSSRFGQVTFSQTNSQVKPSQIPTDSKFESQQGSAQFGSQSFTSDFSSSSKPSASQSSQFSSKPTPSSPFGQSLSSQQTSTQFEGTGTQFSQKPIVQSQTQISQSSTGETSDSSQSPTQQYQGTIYQYNKPAETLPAQEHKDTSSRFGQSSSQFGSQSSFQQTQIGSNAQTSQSTTNPKFVQKPQSTQGSSFTSNTYSQTQTSQFGKKPSGTFGQTSLGQKPSGTTHTGSYHQQGQFGSTGSQSGSKLPTTQSSSFNSNTFSQGQTSETSTSFGIKPTQQAQFGTNSQFSQSQTSQFENKPSTPQTGSTIQPTQFAPTSFQFGQNSQSPQSSGSVSATSKPSIGQKPFGSSSQQAQFGSTGFQFGSKPQTTQGSSFSSNTFTQSQTSQFGKKPTTPQTGSVIQPAQFGSTGFQFGQNSQSTQNSGSVSATSKPSIGQKPFGSSSQQAQFGSTGFQFGSKPQTTQGSSFSSNTYTQSQTSQFGKKPSITQTGSVIQPAQFGSTGFQFGQNSQSTQNSGSVSATNKPSFGLKPLGSSSQQTQFELTGSQFGSKPQTTQGSSFSSNTYTQSQTSQFGKKPSSTTQTGSAIQPTKFGPTSYQFGQNSHSAQSSGSVLTTSKPLFGQKPFGSSYQQTQFGPTGSQFGSKPQTTQGSSFTSNSYSQSQTSQFGKKPSGTTQTGSTFQQTQNQFGQKPQITSVAGVTSSTGQTSFAQKPSDTAQAGSFYQQAQLGSIGSQLGQKLQSATQGSSFHTSNTQSKGPSIQTSQFGLTSSSQNMGSISQNNQFGSATGSQYEQKQELSQGIKDANVAPQTQFGQTSQSGNKLSGSSSALESSFQQSQFSSGSQFGLTSQKTQGTISQAQPVQTNQYGVKPFGSSQIGSTPTRFGQTSQINVPTSTTTLQTAQPTQFGQKPFQTQFGSTTGHFGQKPQAEASAFTSNSDSNAAPFGGFQTDQVSKYQQTSQFGVQSQDATSAQQPLGTYLLQNNFPQFQYTQTSDKSGSQASQSNVGSGQLVGQTTFDAQSQKPFGSQSTQTTYQQTQFNQNQKPFGSTQSSGFQIGQSIGQQPTQSSIQTSSVTGQSAQNSFGSAQSAAGYNYQKPQSVFTTQYGGQPNGPQDQNVQQTQSNFNSVISTSQAPINGQPLKPFGISSAQGTFQQTQSNAGSFQFTAQPTKATEISGPVIQTFYNQLSGQPFKPASTPSTQSSSFQSQSSVVSTSQFGLQPTKPADLTHLSGQPFQSASTQGSSFESQNLVGSTHQFHVQPTQGALISTSQSQFTVEPYNPNASSTGQAPSFPNRVGSNLSGKPEGLAVSTIQTPIEKVTPSHGFAGLGEQFGGPRDPPTFDDKTGYHY